MTSACAVCTVGVEKGGSPTWCQLCSFTGNRDGKKDVKQC